MVSYAQRQADILVGRAEGEEPSRRRTRQIESADQSAVIAWARGSVGAYPALELLYAIPNGGRRDAITGARMKREGVKAGVLDIHLPVPSGAYVGLWVEMKTATGTTSQEQKRVIELLRAYGHRVEVCRSAHDAITVIESYCREVHA